MVTLHEVKGDADYHGAAVSPFRQNACDDPFDSEMFFFLSLSLSLLRESAQLKPDAEQNFIIRRINPSVGSSSFHASLPRPRELLKAHTCPIGLLILQNLFMYHPIRLQRKTFFFQLRGESRTCFMEETCGQRVPLPGGVGLHLIPLYRKKGGVSKKREKKNKNKYKSFGTNLYQMHAIALPTGLSLP